MPVEILLFQFATAFNGSKLEFDTRIDHRDQAYFNNRTQFLEYIGKKLLPIFNRCRASHRIRKRRISFRQFSKWNQSFTAQMLFYDFSRLNGRRFCQLAPSKIGSFADQMERQAKNQFESICKTYQIVQKSVTIWRKLGLKLFGLKCFNFNSILIKTNNFLSSKFDPL